MQELKTQAYNEYLRTKNLAKIFRKLKKFSAAIKYYNQAAIHLKYYKELQNF